MKSQSSSCFGSLLLLVVALILVRLLIPELFLWLAVLFEGALYAGGIVILLVLAVIGYFTYKNLMSNKQQQEEKKFAHVTRTEALYRSVVDHLQRDIVLNQVSAEEFLQSEILIGEKIQEIKKDLIRLKDFASPGNQKLMNQQLREYKQQLQESSDPAVKEIVRENVAMLDEKKQRIATVTEEIHQKEASLDLIFNTLSRVEEDLKFGRAVSRLFPAEIYKRFGVEPPSDAGRLPPLTEKSSTEG